MPREKPPVAEDFPRRGAGEGGEPVTHLRILVVEDDEWNVALMMALLSRLGHEGRYVSDGRTAVSEACAGHYDVMLLDLHMPDMDGFEVVRAVREQERITNRHLPIIAVTARASQRDRERCLAAGMDAFVAKPFERDELWMVVRRVVALYPKRDCIVVSAASR